MNETANCRSPLENAEISMEWVAAYMGKDISRCSEAEKLMAIEAFPVFSKAIPNESDDAETSSIERAKAGLRWVAAYMGKEISRCDESDKLRA